ncbi:MAG: metallophosphoesterase [Acidobacteriota bacterium]|nr:metallophosphoesterase [Acidobacteriota bacterium]
MTIVRPKLLIFLLLIVFPAFAEAVYTYVGNLDATSVLIAWGSTKGPNTIGRSSGPLGKAVLTVGDRKIDSSRNWAVADGLEPDHDYHYEVAVDGKKIGEGRVHTWPQHATALCFFVLGDYGTGTEAQFQISRAMEREYKKRAASKDPVRFVITTGDNIYADLNLGFKALHSGNDDADWDTKFFKPYQSILREVPFYPSPGNHDGNGTENRGDLNAYLDNFYYPGNTPARWYKFQFADLAEFFSFDSTTNTEFGRPRPVYTEDGEEFAWTRKTIAASKVPWKIPYWHHPVFNAGPFHPSSYKQLQHFLPVFQQAGVKVVFSGHEHNFQFSEQNQNTSGIRFVISGAGGELRHGDVRHKMQAARIEGWSPELHFLIVEIDGKEMRITPMGVAAPLNPVDQYGSPLKMPLLVRLP